MLGGRGGPSLSCVSEATHAPIGSRDSRDRGLTVPEQHPAGPSRPWGAAWAKRASCASLPRTRPCCQASSAPSMPSWAMCLSTCRAAGPRSPSQAPLPWQVTSGWVGCVGGRDSGCSACWGSRHPSPMPRRRGQPHRLPEPRCLGRDRVSKEHAVRFGQECWSWCTCRPCAKFAGTWELLSCLGTAAPCSWAIWINGRARGCWHCQDSQHPRPGRQTGGFCPGCSSGAFRACSSRRVAAASNSAAGRGPS